MKKLVFVVLALLVTISFSQDFATKGLTQGGFKLGVGQTTVRDEADKIEIEDYKPEISGRFGFFLDINFMEYVGLETGLGGHIKHGTSDDATIEPYPTYLFRDSEALIVALDMPFFIQGMYEFEESGIQPVIFIGPVFNYSIYHHYSYDYYEDDHLDDEIDDLDGFDVSLGMGLGSEFAVGNGRLLLNFRYDKALAPVYHGDEEGYELYADMFTVEIGYAFRRKTF